MEANKENQQSIEQAFEQALDAYKAGNFAEAAGQWLALAEDGCAPAQRALGSLYERGQGVEKNAENAFEWTKKAAEQNDPVAMFNLACYHDKGFGAKKNQQTALTWYRKAAEYGHPEAAALIASLIETGDRGLEKDMDEAVRWYQIAANRGNVLAMGRLAWLYSTGTGVPQDAAFAFQYFLKAAQGGNAACMMNTAILYARGEGTPHNAREALYWAEQAKKHGAPQAEQSSMPSRRTDKIENRRFYVGFSFCRSDQAAQLIFLYHTGTRRDFHAKLARQCSAADRRD